MQTSGPLYTRRSEVIQENSYQNHNGGYTGPVWNNGGPELRPIGTDRDYRTSHELNQTNTIPPVEVSQPAIVDPLSQILGPAPIVQAAPSNPIINVNELVSRIFNNNNKSNVVPSFANPSSAVVQSITTSIINPSIVTPTTVISPSITANSAFDHSSWVGSKPKSNLNAGNKRKKHAPEKSGEMANQSKPPSPPAPEPPLSWNNLDSLKIVRPTLIATIYEGRQCTSCPLRFFNSSKDYQSHLDWHFRQNKKKKGLGSVGVLRRNWYYPLHLWLLFKEVSDEDDTSELANSDELMEDKESNSNDAAENVSTQPTVRASEDDSHNSCKVCGDKFELFFDHEEDAWLLRNAVKAETGNCHPLCLPDLSRTYDDVTDGLINNEEPAVKEEEEPGTEVTESK